MYNIFKILWTYNISLSIQLYSFIWLFPNIPKKEHSDFADALFVLGWHFLFAWLIVLVRLGWLAVFQLLSFSAASIFYEIFPSQMLWRQFKSDSETKKMLACCLQVSTLEKTNPKFQAVPTKFGPVPNSKADLNAPIIYCTNLYSVQ